MHPILAAAAALAPFIHLAAADNCAAGAQFFTNNAYCQAVKEITYSNFGGKGSYQRVTSIDESSGQCTFAKEDYDGHFAPLDEQLSIHIRGPLKLKQMAVYMPGDSSPKKKCKRRVKAFHRRRHAHQHAHEDDVDVPDIEQRAVGDKVVATIDGKVVTWANQYAGPTPSSSPQPGPKKGASKIQAPNKNPPKADNSSDYASSDTTGSDSTGGSGGSGSKEGNSNAVGSQDSSSAPSSWKRVAYYDESSQTQQGLTLMGNKGSNDCSGIWGPLGNSLSYVSSDGSKCASSPQMLEKDNFLPTDSEISFFSDQKCSGSECGYTRSGVPNYLGWGGDEKAFFFEFQMPDDGKMDMGANMSPNMPAIWLLNAAIPRLQQYGKCSCWESGCGEFDLFEVLHPENDQKGKAKSCIHREATNSFGDSDYFDRPFDKTIKLAAIMSGSDQATHIVVLDDGTDFADVFSKDQINKFGSLYSGKDLSKFGIS